MRRRCAYHGAHAGVHCRVAMRRRTALHHGPAPCPYAGGEGDTSVDAHTQRVRPEPVNAPGRSFTELVRAGCEAYVVQGIGLPMAAYVFHAVKLSLFALGWMFFVSFTPGLGAPWDIGAW